MATIFLYKWTLWLMTVLHPYYVSVTEIEYQAGTKDMGISCKFFTDDLEEALRGSAGHQVNLLNGNTDANRKLIGAYILKHLKIKAGNTPVAFTLIGYELEKEAIWCYFEAHGISPARKFSVESDMLYETKKEQVNLFHITVDGERKSSRLANPENAFSVEFK
jgi:hypothetical protein